MMGLIGVKDRHVSVQSTCHIAAVGYYYIDMFYTVVHSVPFKMAWSTAKL